MGGASQALKRHIHDEKTQALLNEIFPSRQQANGSKS